MSASGADDIRISGLNSILESQRTNKLPPVEDWNPPSRGDIGLAIKSDGTWHYQGSPIERKPLVKLFSRILRRDDDGRHYLVTPVERVEVAVEDAPFLAVEMQVEGEGAQRRLVFRTNVDDVVYCGPSSPMRFTEEAGSGGLKPYLLVRGRLEALVTRALCYDLVDMALNTKDRPPGVGDEQPGLWSGGRFFELEADG
jgi:hypothetical protein